tara:strand:- start:2184 stop:2759 length:576 start_codon:yes stop_codon:yes gene_type:complete
VASKKISSIFKSGCCLFRNRLSKLMEEDIVRVLREWNESLYFKVKALVRMEIAFNVINIVLLAFGASASAALLALESMSLGSELNDGNSSVPLALSRFVLTVFVAAVGSIMVSINPKKKGADCNKASKDYCKLSRDISGKIDKYQLGLCGQSDEELKEYYCKFVDKYQERETVIAKLEPFPSNNFRRPIFL